MAKLKDYINADLGTFFNPNEFGEEHLIDGVLLFCIFDKDLSERERQPADLYNHAMGVFKNDATLLIQTELINPPDIEQVVDIDGEKYRVTSVSDQQGLLKIGLEVNDI